MWPNFAKGNIKSEETETEKNRASEGKRQRERRREREREKERGERKFSGAVFTQKHSRLEKKNFFAAKLRLIAT